MRVGQGSGPLSTRRSHPQPTRHLSRNLGSALQTPLQGQLSPCQTAASKPTREPTFHVHAGTCIFTENTVSL